MQTARGCKSVEKPLSLSKNGVWGVAPSGVRAAAPHSAPARMPGVYAQRLCTMQSQQSIHSLSPGKGVWGVAPSSRLSASLCRCIVQRLGVADYKHPCLSRDASPRILPPARMPGVYAKRLCTMQSQQSIHSLSHGKGGRGKGIKNSSSVTKMTSTANFIISCLEKGRKVF